MPSLIGIFLFLRFLFFFLRFPEESDDVLELLEDELELEDDEESEDEELVDEERLLEFRFNF